MPSISFFDLKADRVRFRTPRGGGPQRVLEAMRNGPHTRETAERVCYVAIKKDR